ncbi:hypothetical protein ACF0H5_007870 [Mactra antiquata]
MLKTRSEGYIVIVLLCMSVCETTYGVHVNCGTIRHNEVSHHRFTTCLRNIRGILSLMCTFSLQGGHMRRITRSEVQDHLFCDCCTQRCSRSTLMSLC